MKKIFSTFSKKILRHELITGSVYLFGASMAVNVVAFLFNLFLARKTSVSQYGEYVALMSFVGLATITGQSLGPILVKFSSDYLHNNEMAKAVFLYKQSTKFIIIASASISILLMIFSPLMENFLHIHNFFLLFIASLVVGVIYAGVVNVSFLQSLLRFRFMAINVSLGAAIKIVCGIFFVAIGLQVAGALWAIFLSFAIPYFISFLPLMGFFHTPAKNVTIHLNEVIEYAISTTVIVFALSSFTSTDLLLVKHFFSPSQAGIYAGISTVGKVIFYFTGTIPSVMFPLLIKHYHEGKNIHKLFFFAIFLVLIPSIFITIIYFLFPNFVIHFFLQKKIYEQAVSLLGFFALYMTLFSIVNLMVNFFLSVKQTQIMYVIFLAVICQIMGIVFLHNNFGQVISVSVIVMLVLLMVLLVYYGKLYGKRKTISLTNSPSI